MRKEEIVGLMINGEPVDGWKATSAFKNNGCRYDRYITRGEAQLMAGYRLGEVWEQMAMGPAIMILDEEGLNLPKLKMGAQL